MISHFIFGPQCHSRAARSLPKSLYLSSSEGRVQVLTKVDLRPDVAFGPLVGLLAAAPAPGKDSNQARIRK